MHTDLMKYSKNFLDANVVPLIPDAFCASWEATEGDASTVRVTKLASKIIDTYSLQLNGTVKPYVLAVSNYGEHFMERVHKYEAPEDGADSEAGAELTDEENMQGFIERVAARFIEPALVRVVAVFLVLGDEVKRFRIRRLEPALSNVWEQMDLTHANQARQLITDAIWRTGRSVHDGVRGNLDGFYDAAVQEWMKLDADGDGKVSLEEFRLGVQGRLGAGYDATMAPLVAKAFTAAQQSRIARALLSVQTTFAPLKAAAYAEWMSLDADGDEHVSFEDFKAGVQRRLAEAWKEEMLPVLRKMHLASRQVAGQTPGDADADEATAAAPADEAGQEAEVVVPEDEEGEVLEEEE